MIAKLAFITSPEGGRFMLHVQTFGTGEQFQFEIARSQLGNIVADGAHLLLRESSLNRVPVSQASQDAQHGPDAG